MNYEDAIILLQLNHIYPNQQVLVTKKGKEITGLEVPCNPLTMDMRKEHCERVLEGKGFRVDKMSNLGYVLITKEK